ncbi:zinc-dependent metalloprotease family protein [Fodinibius sp. Rm-B-1B1-1]|uniref:zinc-dependent metalloprotease family protein n=1 Tax=Fodinibius alkaliphilus TaxID=3140241 RepID=UPI00315A95A8
MISIKRFSILLAFCSLSLLIVSCSDSTTGPDDSSTTKLDSKQKPGNSAELFLQDDQYTSLQVEIDYMPGHEPTQDGIDSLKTFLVQRLNKQNISFRSPTQIDSRNQSSYTAADIRSIEENERDHYTESDGSTLQVYFLVVDAKYNDGDDGGSNVLGIAYWNTSVAFFGETIEEVSSGIGAPPEEKIEGTVFRHEFGHNMGLTGNGTPHPSGQSNHQNGDAHCSVDGCLMEPAVETGNFFTNTFDGDIPNLDPLCIEDLQANGGK